MGRTLDLELKHLSSSIFSAGGDTGTVDMVQSTVICGHGPVHSNVWTCDPHITETL